MGQLARLSFFVAAFVLCKGQQQCTQQRSWPLYLNGIYCMFSSYYFQHDLAKFNVKNLNDWGKGGEPGIFITKDNQEAFFDALTEYNLCLSENRSLSDSRRTALNSLLDITLKQPPIRTCPEDRTLRVTGTFVRMSDVNIQSCPNVNRTEVFATDTFYFDQDFVNHEQDFQMSIVAPQWVVGRKSVTINLSKGNFLGIYESYLNASELKISTSTYGSFSPYDKDGLVFYEISDKSLKMERATHAADNFVKTVKNFNYFMVETSNNKILRERIAPFMTKVSAHPYTKPESQINEGTFFQDTFVFSKNLKYLSIEMPSQLTDSSVVSDPKLKKLIFTALFSQISVAGDNKFRGLVVDFKELLDYHVNNLEHIERGYSGTLAQRMKNEDQEHAVRATEVAIIKHQRKQLEKYLTDVVDGNLAVLRGIITEVEDATGRLREARLGQIKVAKQAAKENKSVDDLPDYERYVWQRVFIEVVGDVATIMTTIPLAVQNVAVKGSEGFGDAGKLVRNVPGYCQELTNRIKKEEEEIHTGLVNATENLLIWQSKEMSDLCDVMYPQMLHFGSHVVETPATSYGNFKNLFGEAKVFQDRVGDFVSKYYGRSGEFREVVRRLKFALATCSEIVDAVGRYETELKLEEHVDKLKNMKYDAGIAGGLAVLEEVECFNVNEINMTTENNRKNEVTQKIITSLEEQVKKLNNEISKLQIRNVTIEVLQKRKVGSSVNESELIPKIDGLKFKWEVPQLKKKLKECGQFINRMNKTLLLLGAIIENVNAARYHAAQLANECCTMTKSVAIPMFPNVHEFSELLLLSNSWDSLESLISSKRLFLPFAPERIVNFVSIDELSVNLIEISYLKSSAENISELLSKFYLEVENSFAKLFPLLNKNTRYMVTKFQNPEFMELEYVYLSLIANLIAEIDKLPLLVETYQLKHLMSDKKKSTENAATELNKVVNREIFNHGKFMFDNEIFKLQTLVKTLKEAHTQTENFEELKNRETTAKKARKQTASQLSETLTSVEKFSKSHLVVLEYNRLINAVKQFSFPLFHLYFTHFDIPTELDVKTSSIGIAQRIKQFKWALQHSGHTMKYEEFKRSPVIFNSDTPFFTFNDPRAVKNFLRGREIILLADIHQTDLTLNAVKFNRIGLAIKKGYMNFEEETLNWTVSLTHLGDSKYSCDGRVYAITTLAQKFIFTMAMKNGTDEPLITNSVYNKISRGDFVLSPYASWKLQIVKGLNPAKEQEYMEMADYVSLLLVGRGQYYEGDSTMCSENLDQYYERFDDVYEAPKVAARTGLADNEDNYFTKPLKCTTAKQPWVTEKTQSQGTTVQELSFKHNVQ